MLFINFHSDDRFEGICYHFHMVAEDYLRCWKDHPGNPLIEPPWPEFLLGDPAVVVPEESPDESWHLFANTVRGIHHFTSVDGLRWNRRGRIGPGWRAFIYKEDDTYYLFSEHFTVPQFRSHIVFRTSQDLWDWSGPTSVLEPTLEWEGRFSRNTGNPCLVRTAEGYRLYFSAGVVFFRDLGFCEPRYIGVAEAGRITGPYRKRPEPIISPSPENPYRNRGAGAIKVIFDEKRGLYYGFNNGMYTDGEGRTRSAILLLESGDGIDWEQACPEPIIAPGGDGWKKALVYQLDVRKVGDEMWLYYNARGGWRFGKERIGLATCPVR